jgi:alkylation response protein AidB-like acyl-CoA dehydrogenase
VPRELLDTLADAGQYGLAVPVEGGGLGADFGSLCATVERLASGCLTTALAWAQHLGLAKFRHSQDAVDDVG